MPLQHLRMLAFVLSIPNKGIVSPLPRDILCICGVISTLCWNRSGKGKELKSSSASAISAFDVLGGVLGSLRYPVTRLVSFRSGREMCFSMAARSWIREETRGVSSEQ